MKDRKNSTIIIFFIPFKSVIVATLLLIILSLVVSENVYGKIFNSEELIEEALRNSKELHIISRELDKCELEIQKIYANLLPRISVSASLNHYLNQFIPFILREDIEERFYGTIQENNLFKKVYFKELSSLSYSKQLSYLEIQELFRIPPNSMIAALSITQPLFLQGKIIPNVKIQQAYQAYLLCRYEEEKSRIKSETMKMFYRVLLEQQKVKIKKNALELAEESHRLTKKNFLLGKSRELDTLNSVLRLENALLDYKNAERERKNACEEIISFCNIPVKAEDFWVEGEFTDPVFFITIDEAIVQLHKGNFQIRRFKGSENIRNEMINLKRLEFLPEIYFGYSGGLIGQFSEISEIGSPRWGSDQKIFIALKWEFFSGSRMKEVRQQKIEREILYLTQQKIIDSLELCTRIAYEEVMKNVDRFSSVQRIVDAAKKNYEIAKKELSVGTATPFDLQNAELELSKAQLLYTETLYNFHIAAIEFRFLIGAM
ncbi:MAG: TolC family protein [Chitinispirillaceae bacterium]|nr:TolC family protein [Chitinispirillaceae bacterium]